MRRLYLMLTLPVMLVVWSLFVPIGAPLIWDARGWLELAFRRRASGSPRGPHLDRAQLQPGRLFWRSTRRRHRGRAGAAVVAGAFSLCRHPLYFFMTLLAAAETFMPLGRALMAAALLVYVAVGSRLEETKLARDFGPDYERYRARTPWLVPTPASMARAWRAQP